MNSLRNRKTFEQRRRWSTLKAEAHRQRWLLGAANAALLLPAAAMLALGPLPPQWSGLVAGVLIASSFWMTYTVLLIRTYPVTMGEWGESFTRDFLARRRPRGWRVIDDVPMERRNVDHVAIAPGAVLAIETKFIGAGRDWRSDPWRVKDLDDARRSARSVRSLVRSQGVELEVPVIPVLMLWGAGSSHDELPAVTEGVHVVYGPTAQAWATQWENGPIEPVLADRIQAGLKAFQATRDEYSSARSVDVSPRRRA